MSEPTLEQMRQRSFVFELLRRLLNLLFYGKWNNCEHDWTPVGFADWDCSKCGAHR